MDAAARPIRPADLTTLRLPDCRIRATQKFARWPGSRPTLSTAALPVAGQNGRAGAMTGIGVEEQSRASTQSTTRVTRRVVAHVVRRQRRGGGDAAVARLPVSTNGSSAAESAAWATNRQSAQSLGSGALKATQPGCCRELARIGMLVVASSASTCSPRLQAAVGSNLLPRSLRLGAGRLGALRARVEGDEPQLGDVLSAIGVA